MIQVEIDNGSGFCFGVTTAIKKAEEELAAGKKMYCLGDIVHNGMEVERLTAMGMTTINHEQLRELHDVKVLLRAHGEPPETYELARRNNIEIIDATCPVVLQLQKRIKKQFDANPDAQIVIFGKNGHAEVLGLVGQTRSEAIVIEHFDEVSKLDFNRDIYLFANHEEFRRVPPHHRVHSIAHQPYGHFPQFRHHLPTGGQPHAQHCALCNPTRCDNLCERTEKQQRESAF